MIATDKKKALADYHQTAEKYTKNMSRENWILFCEAKKTCMLLGVRI